MEKISRRNLLRTMVASLAVASPMLVLPSPSEAGKIPYLIFPETYSVSTREELYNDPDEILLARMLFGEARNISPGERITIGYTPFNRVRSNRNNTRSIKEALLAPKQFSCFNENDKNFQKILSPLKTESLDVWLKCLECAKNHLDGKYENTNNGATHYHGKYMRNPPEWAKDMAKLPTSPAYVHDFYIE